jgi:type II secretory pathway pseudopilin PulG
MEVPAKRRLTPSVVVAIIGMAAATVLGGVTIWQSSAENSVRRADEQRKTIELKLDNLITTVHSMDLTIARIGQRLEDHLIR